MCLAPHSRQRPSFASSKSFIPGDVQIGSYLPSAFTSPDTAFVSKLKSSGYTHKSRTSVQNTGANLGLSSPFSQNRHTRKKNLKKALPYDSRMCFICALGSKARNLLQALPPPEDTPWFGDMKHPVPRGNPFIQAPCSSRATKASCSGPCPEYLQNLRFHLL